MCKEINGAPPLTGAMRKQEASPPIIATRLAAAKLAAFARRNVATIVISDILVNYDNVMHNLQSCHAHKIAELQRYVLP
jgi:precorrin-3B methylase